jgi:broad specificity phosphatase PhoE
MIIVVIRHAERVETGNDPGLTEVGQKRAVLLARMLRQAGVTAIFTSTWRRTKETAAPLAEALHVTPQVLQDDPTAARGQLLSGGDRVLVVGHTDTVPALIAGFDGPADVVIQNDEFDRMFVLTVGHGQPALLAMRYGAGKP